MDSDHDNHITAVRLGVAFLVSLLLLAFVLRVYSRRPLRELFGSDDIVGIISTCFAVAQGGLVVYSTYVGMGQKPAVLSLGEVKYCGMLIYVSDLLFVAAVYTSKISGVFSLRRLSNLRDPKQRQATTAILAAAGVFFVISIIIVGSQSGAPAPQLRDTMKGRTHTAAAWGVYVALSGLLDLALIIYPMILVMGLQMSIDDKSKVIFSFGIRILLIPISVGRIVLLARNDRSMFPYSYSWPEVLTQAEMCYAIIAATMPCLRPLLVQAQTGLFDQQGLEFWAKRASPVEMEPTPRTGITGRESPSNQDGRTVSAIYAGREPNGLVPRDVDAGGIEVQREFGVTSAKRKELEEQGEDQEPSSSEEAPPQTQGPPSRPLIVPNYEGSSEPQRRLLSREEVVGRGPPRRHGPQPKPLVIPDSESSSAAHERLEPQGRLLSREEVVGRGPPRRRGPSPKPQEQLTSTEESAPTEQAPPTEPTALTEQAIPAEQSAPTEQAESQEKIQTPEQSEPQQHAASMEQSEPHEQSEAQELPGTLAHKENKEEDIMYTPKYTRSG